MLVLRAGGRPDPTCRYWSRWDGCNPKSFTCDLCKPSVTRSSVCWWILVSECVKSSLITCLLRLRSNLLCRMILPEAWCCQSAIYLWFLLKLTLLSACGETEPCVLCIEHLWAVVRWLSRTGSADWRLCETTVTIRTGRFPSRLNTMNLAGRVEEFLCLFLLLPAVQRQFSFIEYSLNYYPQSWLFFLSVVFLSFNFFHWLWYFILKSTWESLNVLQCKSEAGETSDDRQRIWRPAECICVFGLLVLLFFLDLSLLYVRLFPHFRHFE